MSALLAISAGLTATWHLRKGQPVLVLSGMAMAGSQAHTLHLELPREAILALNEATERALAQTEAQEVKT